MRIREDKISLKKRERIFLIIKKENVKFNQRVYYHKRMNKNLIINSRREVKKVDISLLNCVSERTRGALSLGYCLVRGQSEEG
jgi:hypothetical protein